MPEDTQSDPGTHEFLVGAMERALDRQFSAVDGLDSKMVQVFATASVVIGLAAAGLHNARHETLWLLVLSLVGYVVVVCCAAVALWVRSFSTVPDPDELWKQHSWDTVAELRITLCSSMESAYLSNRKLMVWKTWPVKIAILATGVEAVSIGTALILTVTR